MENIIYNELRMREYYVSQRKKSGQRNSFTKIDRRFFDFLLDENILF